MNPLTLKEQESNTGGIVPVAYAAYFLWATAGVAGTVYLKNKIEEYID